MAKGATARAAARRQKDKWKAKRWYSIRAPRNPWSFKVIGETIAEEEKALLGKFLFWEEQLSHDNSTSCGTCHIPEVGGSDPRVHQPRSIHPGYDGIFGNADDVVGSIGVVLQACGGDTIDDGIFFPERQVTGRRSPSFIASGYHPTLFWDGRAGPEFVDPETGQVLIATGGALEAQAVAARTYSYFQSDEYSTSFFEAC